MYFASRRHNAERYSSSSSSSPVLPSRPPNFPTAATAPRRIIFGSCSDAREDLTYWDAVCDLQPDLVLLMGDNVYGKRSSTTATASATTTTSSLKQEYDRLQNHPSFQRAQQQLCILAIADDNDYFQSCDKSNTSSKNNQKATPFMEDIHHPAQLFCDFFQPTLAAAAGSSNNCSCGLYQSYSWGTELLLILLDTRTFASPLLVVKDSNDYGPRKGPHQPDYEDSSKTMLGDEQWRWLEEQLSSSFQLTIIVSPQQVLSTGHAYECWHMLPHERQRLLQLLRATNGATKSSSSSSSSLPAPSRNLLLLSGDRHVSALYRDDRGETSSPLYEVTCSSLTHSIQPPGVLDVTEKDDEHRISDFVYDNNFGMLRLHSGDGGDDDSQQVVVVTIHHATSGKVLKEWKLKLSS